MDKSEKLVERKIRQEAEAKKWAEIKEEYMAGYPVSDLARKHKLAPNAIHMRAKRHGWKRPKIESERKKKLSKGAKVVIGKLTSIVGNVTPEELAEQDVSKNMEGLRDVAAVVKSLPNKELQKEVQESFENGLDLQIRRLQKNGGVIVYDLLLKLKEELDRGRKADIVYIKTIKEAMIICKEAGVTADKISSSVGHGQTKSTLNQQFNIGGPASAANGANVPKSASGNLLSDDPINERVGVNIQLSRLEQQLLDEARIIEAEFEKNRILSADEQSALEDRNVKDDVLEDMTKHE